MNGLGKIYLRGGPAKAWRDANPVPAAEELCVETDTKRGKVGDGVTKWNDLPYAFSSVGFSTETAE
jgi:hypothetical protein